VTIYLIRHKKSARWNAQNLSVHSTERQCSKVEGGDELILRQPISKNYASF